MIRLYGMGSPNVVKILIMLEETELAYEAIRIDVVGGEQFAPEFQAMNPNRKVPVIVDARNDASPVTVFESGAILLYLAEISGQFLPADISERYATIQWLMLQMAGFGPMAGQAIHFRYAVKEDSYGRMRFTNELRRSIGVLGDRLAASAFVAGDEYSIADMAFFPWIRTLLDFFQDDLDHPTIDAWYKKVAERPAVMRACERATVWSAQDRAALRHADEATRDRYFGRTPGNGDG
jgi:GST-like protein